jgi:hypothetical protein
VPESANVAFICPDIADYPVLPDITYHILSFLQSVIYWFSAPRLNRINIIFFYEFISHPVVYIQKLILKQFEFTCYQEILPIRGKNNKTEINLSVLNGM